MVSLELRPGTPGTPISVCGMLIERYSTSTSAIGFFRWYRIFRLSGMTLKHPIENENE
jgi:hypothetical protein